MMVVRKPARLWPRWKRRRGDETIDIRCDDVGDGGVCMGLRSPREDKLQLRLWFIANQLKSLRELVGKDKIGKFIPMFLEQLEDYARKEVEK